MISNLKISIITVSYNAANTIEQTILSVLNQTYTNFEYIIIDGDSNDGTLDVIKKHEELFIKKGISYKYISEKDNGIYYAMNKGIGMANGVLISLLNADDWYEVNTVEKVVNYYKSNLEVDIIHGILRFISIINNEPYLIRGSSNSFLVSGMIEHPTCFIKKSLYDKVGDFNILYKSASDYEWMLRAKKSGAKFVLISEILTNFRSGGMSDSLLGKKEELLIKKRYGIISTFKYICMNLYVFYLAFRK